MQRRFPVVFLHEPVQVDGDPHLLCPGRYDSERDLRCRWFGRDWGGDCRFAFVCKQVTRSGS